jgi:hypothetical protein
MRLIHLRVSSCMSSLERMNHRHIDHYYKFPCINYETLTVYTGRPCLLSYSKTESRESSLLVIYNLKYLSNCMKFLGILSQLLKFSLSLAKSEKIDENQRLINLLFSPYSEYGPNVELLV